MTGLPPPDADAVGPRHVGPPVRVLHLTTVDMTLALVLETELRAAVAAGHEVVAASAPGPFLARVEATGATFRPVPAFDRRWALRRDLAAIAEVWRLVGEVRPDVLHTHTPKAGVIGRVVGRLRGVPAVVNTVHGLWQPRPGARLVPLKRMLVLATEALASLFSDAELYLNEEDHRALRRVVGRKGEVVGSGIDLERFSFSPAGRSALRAEWGLDDTDIAVVGVGRQVAEKGIHELAGAARRLRAEGRSRVRFLWVGPPDEAKPDAVGTPAAGTGRALGPLDPIELVGLREDMTAVYAAADVFCLPSWREGLSMSGMEAAACGRAMVVSDIRGCRELGRDGRELLLVPPGDETALAAALARVVDDAALRDALGAAAREHARTAFDARRVSARWWSVYRRLLSARRGRRRVRR